MDEAQKTKRYEKWEVCMKKKTIIIYNLRYYYYYYNSNTFIFSSFNLSKALKNEGLCNKGMISEYVMATFLA